MKPHYFQSKENCKKKKLNLKHQKFKCEFAVYRVNERTLSCFVFEQILLAWLSFNINTTQLKRNLKYIFVTPFALFSDKLKVFHC